MNFEILRYVECPKKFAKRSTCSCSLIGFHVPIVECKCGHFLTHLQLGSWGEKNKQQALRLVQSQIPIESSFPRRSRNICIMVLIDYSMVR